MDSFESLVKTIFEFKGYWVQSSFKVNLTKEEKVEIGRPSSPRWEIDVIAYKGRTNELLVVECKSLLDSPGVRVESFEGGRGEGRYKLFNDKTLRRVVFNRLSKQLTESGACRKGLKVKLCLATGKIRSESDREGLESKFSNNGWVLFTDTWLKEQLIDLASTGYENEVALVVTKLLSRNNG